MPVRDPLARTFVDTALELHGRAPWEIVHPGALFLIRIPRVDDPLVAEIMGRDGGEVGLGMYCGPGAFAWLVDRLDEDHDPRSVVYADRLTVTFRPLAEIDDEFRGPLRSAGYRGRKVAPVAAVHPPITDACPVERDDLYVMAWALRCVLEVDERGWLAEIGQPGSRRETVVEFAIDGELDAPRVRFEHVRLIEAAGAPETPLLITLPWGLSDLPRIGQDWLATLVLLEDRIEGQEGPVHVFVVADGKGLLRCGEVALGDDLRPAGTGLGKAMRGGEDARMPAGRPRRIVFRQVRLYRALSSALAAIDVDAVLEVDCPAILDLEGAFAAGLRERPGTSPPPPEVPLMEPASLGEWQAYQELATHLLTEQIVDGGLVTPRVFARYFGSAAQGEEAMERLVAAVPVHAFHEWLVADYRRTSRSKTHLDRLLANADLPFVQRVLFEARRSAVLSIFFALEVEPGVSIEVEDFLTRRRHTVHDENLSTPEMVGYFLPLRLMQVSDWTFATLAGPPLPEKGLDEVLFFLESTGVTITHEGLRGATHGLGVLWSKVSVVEEP